jgi:hypothetical protein
MLLYLLKSLVIQQLNDTSESEQDENKVKKLFIKKKSY